MICCHKSKYLVDGAWFANSYLLPHTAAVFTLLLFAASWFIVNKFTLVDANCCIVYEFVLLPNAIKHILCEFKLNCDTRCGFLVGIHIFFFFLLYADAQMQNFAARLCIVCTFAFFVTRWCKVVYVLQIYICLQTLSPVVRNITNIHYQNHVLFVIINWICSKSKEKKVEREYTTPNWILLDFRKKWKSTRFFVGVHWILEPSWGGWSTWFFPFQFYFTRWCISDAFLCSSTLLGIVFAFCCRKLVHYFRFQIFWHNLAIFFQL